jgi:hypothetical protein
LRSGLVELIALAQAGPRQALHQAIEFGDQAAAQASAIGIHRFQRFVDVARQYQVFGLFEAFGEAQQAQVGFVELGHVRGRPFRALQALPDLKNLTCLMNYPLGKVVLEALATWVFWLGHILTTSKGAC